MLTRRDLLKSMAIAVLPDLRTNVSIQPLHAPYNGISSHVLERAVHALENTYTVRCTIEPQRALPDHAYYKPRNRYRSEKLVYFLNNEYADRYVLGFTTVDISTSTVVSGVEYEDWGIMGQAQSPGTAGIISMHRLKRDWLEKTTVHEFSHMLGLAHCNEPRCNVRDIEGEGSRLDEVELGYFCDTHRKQAREYLRRV